MAIQGLRSTASSVADERPLNWRAGISLLVPNGAGTAPFTALTTKMQEAPTDDPQFNYWTKTMPSRRLRLAANIATNASTITVIAAGSLSAGEYADDATQLKVGDVLMFEHTGELVRVDSLASATSINGITYLKGSDYPTNSALTAITFNGAGVNPYIKVVGSAYREGADTPNPISFAPAKLFNYTQIFRNSLGLTNTAIQTNLRTEEAVKEARREALELHSVDMEMAFWFGARNEILSGGAPLRTTQGFFDFVPASRKTNALTVYPSGVNFASLEELLYNAFLWGSQEKIAWCGMGALLTINRIVRLAGGNHFNLQIGVKEYGFNVSRLTTPFGTLVLWNHPLWNTMASGVNGGADYSGLTHTCAIMDMNGVKYRYLRNRDTKYLPNRQGNGEDQLKAEYLTEAGIEWKYPTTHQIITGLKNAIDES